MSFYNTHTHIFNVPCVPNAFLSNYRIPGFLGKLIRKAVRKKWLRKSILWLLQRIPFKVGGLQVRRYAALVDVAMHRYQDQVFDILASNYASDARMVVLTMNFDYMSGGVPDNTYNHYTTQLHEVLEVKNRYEHKVVPFLFVDPRMGASECFDLVKKHFDPARPLGLVGIKIYPSLGYYPFHPNMDKVYAFAEENSIPVITHANKDGGAYYAGRFLPGMFTYLSFNPTPESKAFLDRELAGFSTIKDPRVFANILMHPVLYTDVLRKYPKLKISFAHFGGSDEIEDQFKPKGPDNWTLTIKSLIRQFPNVYTDISFALAFEKSNRIIATDMADPLFNQRILFGTDFFMTTPYDTDKKLMDGFFKILKPYFKELTDTNPANFLQSKFYNP
jgi:predicted TIM-barrel fold metal-dependent hydrolase